MTANSPARQRGFSKHVHIYPAGSQETEMKVRKIAVVTLLLLGVSGSAAFAQVGDAEKGFYADPVLPDPAPVAVHVFPAATATADVAAVAPAATQIASARARASGRGPACTALNPCAVSAPLARG
jgi:hypothetical protein